MHIIWFLILGGVAGWLAGLVMKGKSMGLFVNMVVGCIGALIGGFVFRFLGIYTSSLVGALFTAFIGAIILIYLANLIKK